MEKTRVSSHFPCLRLGRWFSLKERVPTCFVSGKESERNKFPSRVMIMQKTFMARVAFAPFIYLLHLLPALKTVQLYLLREEKLGKHSKNLSKLMLSPSPLLTVSKTSSYVASHSLGITLGLLGALRDLAARRNMLQKCKRGLSQELGRRRLRRR